MKVESIPFGKFFSNKNTIYKNIMIVSNRARQIMDERYSKVESLKNIELYRIVQDRQSSGCV